MQDDHDLAVREFLGVVRPAVPDQDLARAVVAGRNVAVEVDVVERVILDVDREVILLGVGRDAFGHRPGHENAALLEPEIPMQAARVVLLHDEPRRLGLLARDLGARFGCLFEIAFGLVLGKFLGHSSKVRPQRLSPSSFAPPGRSLPS